MVVVKEFDLQTAKEERRHRYAKESEFLATLCHPNCIAYYDTFENRGMSIPVPPYL